MSIEGKPDGSKKRVVVYFDQQYGDVAKDFAGRMRITDHVDCTLVQSNQFKGSDSLAYGVGAVVIQEGCPNGDVIQATYAAESPDTEIHYMTNEGTWVGANEDEDGSVQADDTGDQEPDQPAVAAVQTEADTPTDTAAEVEAEQPDPADPSDIGDDFGSVESDSDDSAGDAEGQSQG